MKHVDCKLVRSGLGTLAVFALWAMPALAGGGGTGGGNAEQSTVVEVSREIGELRDNLVLLSRRLEFWADPANYSRHKDDAVSKYLYSPEFIKTVRLMNIEMLDTPCVSSDPTHLDASANPEKRLICLSRVRLTRIPQKSLKREIIALGAHEVVHLMGGDESDAKSVQDYLADPGYVADFSSGENCQAIKAVAAAADAFERATESFSIPSGGAVRACKYLTVYKSNIDRAADTLVYSGHFPTQLWFEPGAEAKNALVKWVGETEGLCERGQKDEQKLKEDLLAHSKEIRQALSATYDAFSIYDRGHAGRSSRDYCSY